MLHYNLSDNSSALEYDPGHIPLQENLLSNNSTPQHSVLEPWNFFWLPKMKVKSERINRNKGKIIKACEMTIESTHQSLNVCVVQSVVECCPGCLVRFPGFNKVDNNSHIGADDLK